MSFFFPSNTEREAKGSIPSCSLGAQLLFSPEAANTSSITFQGFLMSIQLASSFRTTFKTFTIFTMSSTLPSATLCRPDFKIKLIFYISFGVSARNPFLTLNGILPLYHNWASKSNYFHLFFPKRDVGYRSSDLHLGHFGNTVLVLRENTLSHS